MTDDDLATDLFRTRAAVAWHHAVMPGSAVATSQHFGGDGVPPSEGKFSPEMRMALADARAARIRFRAAVAAALRT